MRRQIDDRPARGADVLVAARFAPCWERRRSLHRLHRPATTLRAAWSDQQCSDVVKHTPAHQQHPCQGRKRHGIRISKASCGYKSTTDGQNIITLPSAFSIFASIPNSRRKNISSRCFSRFLMSLVGVRIFLLHFLDDMLFFIR